MHSFASVLNHSSPWRLVPFFIFFHTIPTSPVALHNTFHQHEVKLWSYVHGAFLFVAFLLASPGLGFETTQPRTLTDKTPGNTPQRLVGSFGFVLNYLNRSTVVPLGCRVGHLNALRMSQEESVGSEIFKKNGKYEKFNKRNSEALQERQKADLKLAGL